MTEQGGKGREWGAFNDGWNRGFVGGFVIGMAATILIFVIPLLAFM
jgi:hypothetical protein